MSDVRAWLDGVEVGAVKLGEFVVLGEDARALARAAAAEDPPRQPILTFEYDGVMQPPIPIRLDEGRVVT